ncbi:MAG: 4-hydroxy-tetrahydrodipicolinate synthase [Comamonas sp.]
MSVATSVSPDFSGLWIPLVTPFHADGGIDHAALKALVAQLAASGIAGLVVCGSTGEAAALSDAEQDEVLDAVLQTVETAAPRLRVAMGLSGYHLGHVLARVRAFGSRPLAGVLVAAPHYIRPCQQGLLQWFTAIADASAHPLIVYDIPYRTAATLELATLRQLAAHPNIRALKDCGADAAKTQALIADGQLQVLAGEDAHILATLALGGHGAIAASAHWQPQRFVQMMRCVAEGDLPGARRLWQALQPVAEACFAEPNPAPIKALLAAEGRMQPHLRAPMQAASSGCAARIAALAAAQERELSRP